MGYDKEVNFNLGRVQDREEECLARRGGPFITEDILDLKVFKY